MTILAGLALGFLVGNLTGLFGAGGGFLMTPLLHIALGLPMNVAVGTSACQICAASAFSIYHHLDRNFFGLRVAIVMGIGIPGGAWMGSQLVVLLSDKPPVHLLGRDLHAIDFFLLAAYAGLLCLIAGILLVDDQRARRAGRQPDQPRPGRLAAIQIPPLLSFRTVPAGPFSAPVLVLLGLAMGFLSGLLGIGGGVIMVPVLYYLVGQRMHTATHTSLMLIFIAAFFATLSHAWHHNIDYALVVFMVLGSFFGTYTGAWLQRMLSGSAIRRYFAPIVMLAALIVILKLASMLWL